MKIDNVYIVDLMIIANKNIDCNELGLLESTYSLKFLKKALIYEKKDPYSDEYNFIDLRTGRKYEKFDGCQYEGDIVISPKREIIPFRRLVNEVNEKYNKNIKIKDSMTKRKILSMFKG